MCIRRTLQFTRSVPVLPQSLPITPEDRAGTISPILQMITVVLGWWSWEENPGLRTPSPVEVPFAMEYSQVVESSISEPGGWVEGEPRWLVLHPHPQTSPAFPLARGRHSKGDGTLPASQRAGSCGSQSS